MGISLRNFFAGINPAALGNQGPQTQTQLWQGIDGAAETIAPQRIRDVVGKLKISQSQNIYDADFEYGIQPLRWENFITNASGAASIVQAPGLGGVSMTIGNGVTSGDITVRQSRPYHRYQPGKTMYMASNVNFGGAVTGQTQRVGIFDDSNGIFIQQSAPSTTNPYGMSVVVRSDSGGLPVDTVFDITTWNMNQTIAQAINWSAVQMIWMEYAWYGAGALRWGVILNGEPYILHQVGTGNSSYTGTGSVVAKPWSRTGNLPVRYEQRNPSSSTVSVMTHYGVSVLIEGGIDKQRGFTYSYGMSPASPTRSVAANTVRYPVMSFRMRQMGQISQDQGFVYTGANVPQIGIGTAFTSGTTTSLTVTAPGAITVTAASGVGGIATLTFSAQTNPIPVGSNITVAGITPAGYNGTYTVLSSTTTTVTYANATTAAGSAFGTIQINVFPASGYAGRFITYQAVPGGTSANTITAAVVSAATITGSITANTTTLVVTATTQTIYVGMTLSGTNVTSGAIVTGQITGVPGGAGSYTVSQSNATTTSGAITAAGAAVTLTFQKAHGLTASGPFTAASQAGDILNLSGFTSSGTVPANGVYPVIAVPSTTTAVINLGYGVTAAQIGTITVGTVVAIYTARVTANTTTVLTFADIVTGAAMPNAPTGNYAVGLIDRGQLLPQTLLISATATCIVELIASTPTAEVALTGANFQALAGLGSYNSFAERDVSATALSGGEVVYAFPSPPSGLQQIDLSFFFPVLTSIKGNIPDVLTVAITTGGGSTPAISVNVICAEAMA